MNCRLRKKWRTVTMLGSLLVGAAVSNFASAQVVISVGGSTGVGAKPATESEMLGAKLYQTEQLFEMEIRRIDNACKLADAQRTKLKVGSKGVAKSMTEEYGRIIAGMADAAGGVQGVAVQGVVNLGEEPIQAPKGKGKKVEIATVKSFEEINPQALMYLSDDMGTVKPNEHPAWVKLVKATLTPEQVGNYEKLTKSDGERRAKLLIEIGLAKLVQKFVMTSDQADKLQTLALAQANKGGKKLHPYMEDMFCQFCLSEVSSEELAKVLDKQQLELLQFDLAGIRSMGAMMGVEEVGQVQAP